MAKQPATDSQSELNWFQRTYSKVMQAAVAKNAGLEKPGGVKRDYIPGALDSANIQDIQARMRGIAYRNDVTRVTLKALPGMFPGDDCGCGGHASANSIAKAQATREQQFRENTGYARFSTFMVTPTDQQRLNNPAQASFVQQRQLTVPNTRNQFYAFMHAIAAAFGTLDS